MSHFSRTQTRITDANVLQQAIKKQGFKCLENSAVRGYQGQCIKADLVAVLHGDYDLGFCRGDNGEFQAIADFGYGDCGGGGKDIGMVMTEIVQRYFQIQAGKALPGTSRENITVKVHS